MTSITHDREYDLTQGTPGSRISYFTANPNGEAETIKVMLKPNPKIKRAFVEGDFSKILVKGRGSMGNILTKYDVHRILLKAHGRSTLGGRKVWYDHDISRLNFDEHGEYLGEFHSDDSVLVVLDNGEYYTTSFDPNNHYESNILRIEKFNPQKVWTLALFDAAQQNFLYLKRFMMEPAASSRHQSFMGESQDSQLLLLTDAAHPLLTVTFGGADAFRDPLEIDATEFVAVKGFKAKGKRVTTCQVQEVTSQALSDLAAPEEEELPVAAEPSAPEQPSDEGQGGASGDDKPASDGGGTTIEGNVIQFDLFGE